MAIYTNKFSIVIEDVARITFSDERPPVGLPRSISLSAEIVMTRDNFKALVELANRLQGEAKL